MLGQIKRKHLQKKHTFWPLHLFEFPFKFWNFREDIRSLEILVKFQNFPKKKYSLKNFLTLYLVHWFFQNNLLIFSLLKIFQNFYFLRFYPLFREKGLLFFRKTKQAKDRAYKIHSVYFICFYIARFFTFGGILSPNPGAALNPPRNHWNRKKDLKKKWSNFRFLMIFNKKYIDRIFDIRLLTSFLLNLAFSE